MNFQWLQFCIVITISS